MLVDPLTKYAITPEELQECANAQGITFRRGDILLLRVGFIRRYYDSTREERDVLADSGVQGQLWVFTLCYISSTCRRSTPVALVLNPPML